MTAGRAENDGDRPERLRRLDRVYLPSPVYFVTACTADRKPILASEQVYDALLDYAATGPQHGAWIGAFVLMPDHIHFFVALDEEKVPLSPFVKSLKNALSKALRRIAISSPHWQKGFFDHVLRSEESYDEKWQYVRDNPVRAGLAPSWDAWPFKGEIHPLDARRS